MSLKATIETELKDAMRARDKRTVNALRLVTAAMKQIEVDERIELDDARVLTVLDKLAKQRQESITQYQKAERTALAEQEMFELTLIKRYLPEPLSESEVDSLITEAFYETGAQSMRDMGKIMAYLKPRLQGRADMAAISALIKNKLQ
ncbi:MAG: GatB/YqeY domain-containing protein [Gammaproteobacteria bacterium]|nr:GatB/YqeY domain-containing protein [Gammaproteobacteria bacterium]MCH9717957.1 GatB/YqeY domain-containing protein [Gammaproteobacteria bacterium]MCH9762906.1 GatB/YqeY domain-containing protein [Gammaproteobacteria bacterium]